jgi:hypothetical protein
MRSTEFVLRKFVIKIGPSYSVCKRLAAPQNHERESRKELDA